jgi:serine/threonine protein kinase
LFAELRRRGVLGAVVAYGVAAAGALQLADIVVHALEFPAWTLRALIWVAALGLPVTFLISWFWDLTRNGFVRTQLPASHKPSPPPLPAAMIRDLQEGTKLSGRYHLEGELGRGAMGRVLAAHDEKLDRRVAVKVVTGAHDPVRTQRFIQEARTAGSLEHPNVLAVYDLGEHDGVPFLVTELLEGQNLRKLLRDGALPPGQAQDLAAQLARGLSAAHARGIVHRDLKPENLFVTNDGRLKILDFGLARLTSDDAGPGMTQTGAVFGTPGYLSPEQARGEKVGTRSDIFSAGAVLYEMLSGERAFPGANLIEAGHAALTQEPRALPHSALDGVVVKALSKEPSKRFADGAELSRSIEAAIAGAPPPALVKGSWRRSTALMVSLAMLALGAAAASGLRVIHSTRTPTIVHAGNQRFTPPVIPRIPVPPAEPKAPEAPSSDEDDEPDTDEPPEAAQAMEIAKAVTSQLNKKNPHYGRSGILAGVQSLTNAKKLDSAEKLLDRQSKRDPVLLLDLFLLLRSTNRTDEARVKLLAWLKANPAQDWPAPLLQAYAGMKPDSFVVDRAGNDSDNLCDAYYYLGRLHAPTDAALAREQLTKAAGEQCDQAQYARQLLGELDQKPAAR